MPEGDYRTFFVCIRKSVYFYCVTRSSGTRSHGNQEMKTIKIKHSQNPESGFGELPRLLRDDVSTEER
jgi:hypothetical protein